MKTMTKNGKIGPSTGSSYPSVNSLANNLVLGRVLGQLLVNGFYEQGPNPKQKAHDQATGVGRTIGGPCVIVSDSFRLWSNSRESFRTIVYLFGDQST